MDRPEVATLKEGGSLKEIFPGMYTMADYRKTMSGGGVTIYQSQMANNLEKQNPGAGFQGFLGYETPQLSVNDYLDQIAQRIVEKELEKENQARFTSVEEFKNYRAQRTSSGGSWGSVPRTKDDLWELDHQYGRYWVGEYNGVPVYVDPSISHRPGWTTFQGYVEGHEDGRIYLKPPFTQADGQRVFTYDVERTLAHEYGHLKVKEYFGPFAEAIRNLARDANLGLAQNNRKAYDDSPDEGVARIYEALAAARWTPNEMKPTPVDKTIGVVPRPRIDAEEE